MLFPVNGKGGYTMIALRWVSCLALVAALLVGCSTPASRIRKNPALFGTFPPDVQEKVKQGKIEVGFTKDMVLMALGRPQRIATRTTQADKTVVWSYTDVRWRNGGAPYANERWYRDRQGRLVRESNMDWDRTQAREEYEVLRVEFVGDRVKAIEDVRR